MGSQLLEIKKLELLTSVKGVGPKSAYSLISALGSDTVIQAVQLENKKSLSKAPGVGAKAAAQICLDLGNKIQTVLMYKGTGETGMMVAGEAKVLEVSESLPMFNNSSATPILEEALMACKELGFKEKIKFFQRQKIL